jgi:hypothetical protein
MDLFDQVYILVKWEKKDELELGLLADVLSSTTPKGANDIASYFNVNVLAGQDSDFSLCMSACRRTSSAGPKALATQKCKLTYAEKDESVVANYKGD